MILKVSKWSVYDYCSCDGPLVLNIQPTLFECAYYAHPKAPMSVCLCLCGEGAGVMEPAPPIPARVELYPCARKMLEQLNCKIGLMYTLLHNILLQNDKNIVFTVGLILIKTGVRI